MNKTYTTTYSSKSTNSQKKCPQNCGITEKNVKLNEMVNKESSGMY
jgi:hypothetical protein